MSFSTKSPRSLRSPKSPKGKSASYLIAQRLNNSAAGCIEAGKFDLAIRNLTKAMQISQEGNESSTCSCQKCSLQSCMAFSMQYGRIDSQRKQDHQDTSMTDDTGFIYSQPLRIPPHSLNHPMGASFSLLVTFNLALAHHLSAIQEVDEEYRRRTITKSLKLYELAYKCQTEKGVNSLTFAMIMANNVGEIHRVSKNQQKHEKCLQNLLETMMYMIVVNYGETGVEMDGFFKNTSSLILQGRCAGAA